MSEQNPFLVPATDSASAGRGFDPAGRTVDAGRPVEWLKRGWTLFLKNPGLWIAIAIIAMVIIVILSLVPLVGQLAVHFLTPILGAGLLVGCKSLSDGGELRIDHLFVGFKQNTGNLVLVGVYYLVGMVAIMVVTFLVGGGAAVTGGLMGHGAGAGVAFGGFLLAMLIMLVLMVPLVMAVWFAPALVIFHNVAPLSAMKASFAVCLRNMVPFLVYGVILFVLSVIAAIPLGLGFLVLLPVLIGAHYASYVDLFE